MAYSCSAGNIRHNITIETIKSISNWTVENIPENSRDIQFDSHDIFFEILFLGFDGVSQRLYLYFWVNYLRQRSTLKFFKFLFFFDLRFWRPGMDHTNCSFPFHFRKPRHDNPEESLTNWWCQFSCTQRYLQQAHFLYIPLSPISAHVNWLLMRNSAKHCVGLFKDFCNIRNSKKRRSVLFSEKKNPVFMLNKLY